MQRDLTDTLAAVDAGPTIADPLFANSYLHWRNDRIEALLRVGLGPWLLDELATGRGFQPPVLA